MKTYFSFIIMLFAFLVSAFGLGMEIHSPQIGCRANLDKEEEDTVKRVVEFMHQDLSLINGSFVNEFSNQRFGATSAQVSAFIALLSDAGLWKVQVVFQDFGEQDSAFTLSQSSPESLRLVINSGREDFRLNDFKCFLPVVEARIAKTSNAEQSGAGQPAIRPVVEPEGRHKHQPESEGRSR